MGNQIDYSDIDAYGMQFVPHLFIIGAQKSATTSIHYYLSNVHDIFPTRIKECATLRNFEHIRSYYAKTQNIKLVDKKDYHHRILSSYNGERYILESTTHYTFNTIAAEENIPKVMS